MKVCFKAAFLDSDNGLFYSIKYLLLVQATHKNGKVISFYTMPEYETWKESLDGRTSGWSIKYYKVCLNIYMREWGIC